MVCPQIFFRFHKFFPLGCAHLQKAPFFNLCAFPIFIFEDMFLQSNDPPCWFHTVKRWWKRFLKSVHGKIHSGGFTSPFIEIFVQGFGVCQYHYSVKRFTFFFLYHHQITTYLVLIMFFFTFDKRLLCIMYTLAEMVLWIIFLFLQYLWCCPWCVD